MSDMNSLVTGLSNAITGYMQAQGKQQMDQENASYSSDLEMKRQQAYQQQQLDNQKSLVDYKAQGAANSSEDDTSFDPSMAESVKPGAGKLMQAFADSNDGDFPTYSQGIQLMKTYGEFNPANKAANNQVSGQTLGSMMQQLGADPNDIAAVSKIPNLPSGLAEGFLSKVYKNGQQTPSQFQTSYRAVNPYVADQDPKALSQSPDYAEFQENMTSDGSKTLDPAEFSKFADNASKYVQAQQAAYQKQGLAKGPAYTKALTAASRLASPYSRPIKRRLMNSVHLNVMQQQAQQNQPQ